MFPSAAVTNDYILGGLKPHTFIPLQFWRSEVHNGVGSTGSSAGSRENRFPCLFQPPEAAPTLGPWACINTASYPPVRRWHCFFLSPSASLLQGLCDSFRLTQIIKGHFPVSNPELNHICPVPPAMVFLLQGLTLCDPPWTAARQATLYFTLSLMSIESMIPSNHLIFCHPRLLLPSIFPSIRVFSNEFLPRSKCLLTS